MLGSSDQDEAVHFSFPISDDLTWLLGLDSADFSQTQTLLSKYYYNKQEWSNIEWLIALCRHENADLFDANGVSILSYLSTVSSFYASLAL